LLRPKWGKREGPAKLGVIKKRRKTRKSKSIERVKDKKILRESKSRLRKMVGKTRRSGRKKGKKRGNVDTRKTWGTLLKGEKKT